MADLAVGPAVSFLFENIGRLLAEVGGVTDQAQQLQSKLRKLVSQLRDADLRQDQSHEYREWISQNKELVYDAEDALETFSFLVASRKGKGIAKFLKRCSYILSECYMRHRVGSEIQNLHGRISDLTKSFQECGISVSTEEGPSSRQPPLFRRTYSHVEGGDFVGLEEDVKLLVQQLTSEDEVSPKTVVSICGMGGLGKTTIARKVYNHPNVRQRFDAFGWVSISQQWQAKDILQKILVKIMPEKSKQILKQWTEEQLVRQLYEVQESKKCLIILDDIWSRDAWDHLKDAFPPAERSGSKILLTTRIKDVATYIGPSGFHHEPRLLTDDESWGLLQKKAGQNSQNPGFKELGEKIARCCGGLPLAVVVIGGILATKHELRQWQSVHKNVKSLLERGENIGRGGGDFQKILGLSYNDLPYHLKPCFLYLSIYPEDCDIETETLYQLWMAEGMVSKEDRLGTDESMMDVAERYLGELVKRCMIQVTLNDYGPALRKFKSCKLHDLMRDLCLAKARDENFVKVVDYREEYNDPESEYSNSSSCKCRRIAIFLNKEDVPKYVPPAKEMMKHARSLTVRIFYNGYEKRMASTNFNNFKMLRSLTIEGMEPDPGDKLYHVICTLIQIFKLEIGNLIHLRYLCLTNSSFFMLPSSLGNLKHLETLDLREAELLLVRNVLCKLKNLRHLYLYDPDDVLDSFYDLLPRCCKLQLFDLTKLEILENLNSRYCVLEDLCKLKGLQVLGVLTINLENDCEEIINFISGSQRLKEANLDIDMNEDFRKSEKWLSLLDKLFGSNLFHLYLRGPLGVLPEYKTNFFRNLVELELCGSLIEANLMETLEKLPNLQSFWLRGSVFVGTEIICSGIGFPQLTFLLLNMHNLREWRVEKGALASLSCLKIESCQNLKMIPDGFQFLRKLKELHIRDMPQRFCDRIRNVNGEEGEGEDFHKVCHVSSIVVK